MKDNQPTPIKSSKPFPDESNRADIERMLLHAFEFAVESGLIDQNELRVEYMPVAGSPVRVPQGCSAMVSVEMKP